MLFLQSIFIMVTDTSVLKTNYKIRKNKQFFGIRAHIKRAKMKIFAQRDKR